MIANDLQYRVTKAQAEKFEREIERFDDRPEAHPGVDPRLVPKLRESMESQLRSLRLEMAHYDALKNGDRRAQALAPLSGVFSLGRRLIEARIASGLTQRELAERLEVAPQQIQRYEANEYQAASLTRLMEVAEVLRLALGDTSIVPIEERPPAAAATEAPEARRGRGVPAELEKVVRALEGGIAPAKRRASKSAPAKASKPKKTARIRRRTPTSHDA